MKELLIQLPDKRESRIEIGGLSVPPLPAGCRRLVVTDSHVAKLLPDPAGTFNADVVHVLSPGEEFKTFAAVENICRCAARAELDRHCEFVAWGGGVTGDLTGFSAAVYLRGVRVRQVPTSLLAMVDSSVGGKTGADLPEGKNLIGAFWQPVSVHIDPAFLKTLPEAELRNGLGEVAKMALSFDAAFWNRLESIAPDCRSIGGFLPHAEEVIDFCVTKKAQIVRDDEKESGRRALLNYGHTFGHAVELASDFRIAHGSAVAIGMAAAGIAARNLSLWSEEACARQQKLLETLGLPVRLPAGSDPQQLLQLMHRDKKNCGGAVVVVLPKAIGEVELRRDVPEKELLCAWEELL